MNNDAQYYDMLAKAESMGMTVSQYAQYEAEKRVKDDQRMVALIDELVSARVAAHFEQSAANAEKAAFDRWKAMQNQ